ncbi:trypsin-like serine peptidase [Flavobacterium panacagri]|uniref:trypsin-like serine peptidase n=1 Tax=Flavobacterium panacagri TaxID=3034146 RepID=UPI0025A62CC9|nr:serine protease [Flavobacterium panacagri]
MSYSANEIVSALRTNRREFGDLYFQSQTVLPIEKRIAFEVIVAEYADDTEAFKKAVNYSISNNFIESFLLTFAQSSLETGALMRILQQNSLQTAQPQLQAITNAVSGFSEPDVYLKGIMKNMRLTGKVIINGEPMGTGVLVGPNYFLTAWHVTKSLFDHNNTPLTDVDLSIEFDNFLKASETGMTTNQSLIIQAHRKWYVSHSVCNEVELNNKIPDPKDGFAGFWDYTIIKLKRPVGYERSWVTIDPRALVPPDDAKIILFQHPSGSSLKIDISTIISPRPSITQIPKFRFLHEVNALGGASGGPCFDKEFTLIGIHQGVWPEKLNGRTVNRGIPIDKICTHFNSVHNTNIHEMDFENPFWYLDKIKYEPVIGRDDFQLLLWDSFINPQNNKRLFDIKGVEGTGKTFLTRIAHSALNDIQHLKINCPGEIIGKMDACSFVNYVCGTAGIPLPGIPAFKEYDTTVAAWLRNILADPLLSSLNKVRDKRTVWIMITDLNKFSLEGENLSEFFLLLLSSLKDTEWLRIIIDGFPSNLPVATLDYTQTYRTTELTLDDITSFLNKCFTERGWDLNPINQVSNLLRFVYADKLPDNHSAMNILKKGIINVFEKRS